MISGINRTSTSLQIDNALTLTKFASAAYEDRMSGAAQLQDAAEHLYIFVLASICELTEEEADLLEPLFTQLEIELFRLERAAITGLPCSGCN